MKIYTKTGDKGTTKLVDGSTVDKFDPRVAAYGDVDELNSQLGVVRSYLDSHPAFTQLENPLEMIQVQLFAIGSLLATSDLDVFAKMPAITEKHIMQLEHWIDIFSEQLPPLKNFILPAGHPLAAHLHVARTVCRRSERATAEIARQGAHYSDVLIYLNRLSDLLFTLARWSNIQSGHAEVLWKKEHV